MEEKNKKLLAKAFDKVFDEMDLAPTPPEGSLIVFNKGFSCIVTDDGCYVIKNWNDDKWGTSAWIFEEALKYLKCLPDNPRDAVSKL